MTVKELIRALEEFQPEMEVLVGDFCVPVLDMATIADFNVEESRRTETIIKDSSTERRVLCIMAGDEQTVDIDVNGYPNSQPHFITYDSDDTEYS